jgi:hypothetical protein
MPLFDMAELCNQIHEFLNGLKEGIAKAADEQERIHLKYEEKKLKRFPSFQVVLSVRRFTDFLYRTA